MLRFSLLLLIIVLSSLCAVNAHGQCVDNALAESVGISAPVNGFTKYVPLTGLTGSSFRFIYTKSGPLNVQNFYAGLNGNNWLPLAPATMLASGNEMNFVFYLPTPAPLCTSATVNLQFQQNVGIFWQPVCTFALTIVNTESGARQNLTFVDGISKAYYGGTDNKAHVLTWNSALHQWDYAPLTVIGGWGTVQMDGRMASFADGSRVFFKSKNNRLYNLIQTGPNWTLSQVLPTLPDVTGKVTARNSNEVVFVGNDKQLHRVLLTSGTWTDQIVTPTGGWGSSGVPDGESINLPAGSTDIFFAIGTGALGRIYQVNNAWVFEQISPPNVYDSDRSELLVRETNTAYYKGTDGFIHRYKKSGITWFYEPMSISSASETNISIRTAYLAKFTGEDRIFYKSATGRIYNLYKQNGVWYNYALNSAVTTTGGDLIATEGKIFYINHDQRVHNFYWTGNFWWDVPLSSANQVSSRGCIHPYYN